LYQILTGFDRGILLENVYVAQFPDIEVRNDYNWRLSNTKKKAEDAAEQIKCAVCNPDLSPLVFSTLVNNEAPTK